jgi:hypothetical protein
MDASVKHQYCPGLHHQPVDGNEAANSAALDALAEFFRAADGVVNWNSHPAWPTELGEPMTSEAASWMAKLDPLRKGK